MVNFYHPRWTLARRPPFQVAGEPHGCEAHPRSRSFATRRPRLASFAPISVHNPSNASPDCARRNGFDRLETLFRLEGPPPIPGRRRRLAIGFVRASIQCGSKVVTPCGMGVSWVSPDWLRSRRKVGLKSLPSAVSHRPRSSAGLGFGFDRAVLIGGKRPRARHGPIRENRVRSRGSHDWAEACSSRAVTETALPMSARGRFGRDSPYREFTTG